VSLGLYRPFFKYRFEVDRLSLLGTVPSFHQYRFEVGQLMLPLDRTCLSVIILYVDDRL
jgi:hypothetical protein